MKLGDVGSGHKQVWRQRVIKYFMSRIKPRNKHTLRIWKHIHLNCRWGSLITAQTYVYTLRASHIYSYTGKNGCVFTREVFIEFNRARFEHYLKNMEEDFYEEIVTKLVQNSRNNCQVESCVGRYTYALIYNSCKVYSYFITFYIFFLFHYVLSFIFHLQCLS